jgi:NDP-sugar pyrophosphorylase family protein
MQVVIPMSGQGSRFRAAGYTQPKPLIVVDEAPIIEHVVRMFPGADKVVFICSEEHLETTPMRKVLQRISPKAQIVGIKPHKLGPVYAVLCAADAIDDHKPTIVSYCDYYAGWDFEAFKQQMKRDSVDGCVPCYRGFHPHLLYPNLYAGCRTDSELNLLEIREKHSFTADKMETWQSSGVYYMKSGAMIKKYFQRLMDRKISCKDEYYVSLVYNLLIEDGLKTTVYPQEYFCQWGTAEDLEMYQEWSNYFAGLVGQAFTRPEGQKV